MTCSRSMSTFCVFGDKRVDVRLQLYFFFFFKQKTAYEMRISDWSSDVCSSDLDQAQVQRLHAIALAHGGSDEGAPGPRGEGFYAGYFRDPDGNKLNAFVMG